MTAQYNFRRILDVDPDDSSFTCVGRDEFRPQSKRCQKSISTEDRETASRILNEMELSSTFDMTLELLPELVSRSLCTEVHRSKPGLCQIGQLYTEWKDTIKEHWSLVKGESAKKASERWRLPKLKEALEFTPAIQDEDGKAGHHPFLDKRNTFGNYTYFSSTIDITSPHPQDMVVPQLIDEYQMTPRRRTWPDDELLFTANPEHTVEITALFDTTPPQSPIIEMQISPNDECSADLWPRSRTPEIPLKSPLRAPNISHLSFVSSISSTSSASLPSTRQITPPILDRLASRPQTPADTTSPLPSPTPKSPHAIPWFLRDDYSAPPAEMRSRSNSGFRTSATEEVEIEIEICGVCQMMRGEESCTCNWGDLLFSSDSESNASVACGRSVLRIGRLRRYGGKLKSQVGKVGKKLGRVVRRRRMETGNEQKEWVVNRWHTA